MRALEVLSCILLLARDGNEVVALLGHADHGLLELGDIYIDGLWRTRARMQLLGLSALFNIVLLLALTFHSLWPG